MNHENNFPNTYFYHRITLLRVLITTRSFHAFAVYQSRKIFSKIFPLSIFLDASFFFLNRQSISISQSRSTKSPSTFPLAYHFPSETHSLFSLSLSFDSNGRSSKKEKREDESRSSDPRDKTREGSPIPPRLEWRKSEKRRKNERRKGKWRREEEHGCEWFPTFSITYQWISSSVHVQSPLGVHLTRFRRKTATNPPMFIDHVAPWIIVRTSVLSTSIPLSLSLSLEKKGMFVGISRPLIRDQKPEKIGMDPTRGR